MSSISNVNTLSLVIVSISFILFLGPTSMTMNVFATTNTANQGIGQSQSSNQGSGVVSGGNTAGSGNNANIQSQTNTGNNAAAKKAVDSVGNTANQGIYPSQSSAQ